MTDMNKMSVEALENIAGGYERRKHPQGAGP